ncbi:hypothetical protein Tco_0344939 [Tanacetum coccineum]
MRESKSYNKHPTYRDLYDALLKSLLVDEDGMDRGVVEPSTQKKIRHDNEGQDPSRDSEKEKKKQRRKVADPPKKSSTSKESSKGKTPPKTSKTGKFVTVEESVEEPVHEVAMDVKEPALDDVVNDVDQPQDDADPKKDNSTWFKQPPRLETLDPEWNKDLNVDDEPEQNWFNYKEKASKDPVKFDDLMGSTIDFSNFIKNRLKKDKITKAYLEGLIDWTNPEGDRCPYDLSKPLPLQGPSGYLTIPVDFFFNNDLEYLKIGNSERKYIVSITKTKAVRKSRHDVYSTMKILSVIRVKVNKQFGYGCLEKIVVRRADQQEYTFKEGDVLKLHLNDIEDMLLLRVKLKLFNLPGDDIVHLKKLNVTKPQKEFPGIAFKEPHTTSYDPKGIVYLNTRKQKRLMRADELYKFSDRTLKSVRKILHERLQNFVLGYNKDMPKRKWTYKD